MVLGDYNITLVNSRLGWTRLWQYQADTNYLQAINVKPVKILIFKEITIRHEKLSFSVNMIGKYGLIELTFIYTNFKFLTLPILY